MTESNSPVLFWNLGKNCVRNMQIGIKDNCRRALLGGVKVQSLVHKELEPSQLLASLPDLRVQKPKGRLQV
jgi:hypothetical protein